MPVNIDELFAELNSGDDLRAEKASAELAALGDVILPVIKKQLASENMDERWWAIRTLAHMDSPPTDIFIQHAYDHNEEMRQCAILALVYHPDAAAVPILVENLLNQSNMTANLAASALIEIGIPTIQAVLAIPNIAQQINRIEIIRILSTIGDERAIPILIQAMADDSPSMQYWAEQGLERLGVGMVYAKPN